MRKLYLSKRGNPRWMLRLAVLVAAVFVLVPHAAAQSSGRISLDMKNVTLPEVYGEIKRQTGMSIVFSSEDTRAVGRKNYAIHNQTAERTMQLIHQGTQLQFEISNGVIVITRRNQVAANTGSQQQNAAVITGTVTDESGLPLAGAAVMIVGTQTGVATDAQGNFKLPAPQAASISLRVTYLGKQTYETTWAGTPLNVVLRDDAHSIEKAVISTGIMKRKKDSYTGAVSVVTAEELRSFGNRNALEALQNVDPSFNILLNNEMGSDPNSLPDVQIRGASSMPSMDELETDMRSALNTPLIIMDGFETTLTRFLDMDTDEIESITLLKDAAGSSLYGSRGANGVVVITTKAPESGRLKVSYSGMLNIEIPDLSGYDLLNAREKLALEYEAGYYTSTNVRDDLKLKDKYNSILQQINSGVDTYWLSQPLRTAVGHRNTIKIEGGDRVFRYSTSLQYNNTAGVMKESFRKNFNGTINLSYNHSKVIFRNYLSIGYNDRSDSPYGTFSEYAKLNPYWRIHDDFGNLIKEFDDDKDFWGSTLPKNPMYNASLNVVKRQTYLNLTDNFSIEWRPVNGLTIEGALGITYQSGESDDFRPSNHTDFADYTGSDFNRRGKYVYGSNNQMKYDFSTTVTYNRMLGDDHMINATAHLNIAQDKYRNYQLTVEGFPHETLDFLGAALQYEKDGHPRGDEDIQRLIGVLGNLNYTFREKYVVEASLRYDGSSIYGRNKQGSPFWNAGVAWNMHRENFLRDVKFVEQIKLRGSAGITGAANFNTRDAVATYEYIMDDNYNYWIGARQTSLDNPDLTWQKTWKYNLGLDVAVWNNRLQLSADFYIEDTKGMVSTIDISSTHGFKSYADNVGELQNKGYELRATVNVVRNSDKRLYWMISGAVVHNDNKVVKLSESVKALMATNFSTEASSMPNRIFREGDPYNALYVVPSLGIDPSTGREMYLSRDGSETFAWNARDRVLVGSTEPKHYGNLNTSLRWRDLSVNVAFSYRLGAKLYNSTLINRVENADKHYNVDRRVYEDRWREPGDRTFFKGINETSTTQYTSRFVQNESTFRCSNINVVYNFRDNPFLTKNLGITNLSLRANMSDVFYLSTVKRERGTTYPFSRQFSFSANIVF